MFKLVQNADNLSIVLYENADAYAYTFRNNEGILGFYKKEIKIQNTPFKIPKFLKNKKPKLFK